jgi:hypothetical protein
MSEPSRSDSSDPYTMEMRLCDDAGMVSHERHPSESNPEGGATYLEMLNYLKPPDRQYHGDPFECTGSAHLGGKHIRCTSPAHARHHGPTSKQALNADGLALIRIAGDLRDFVKGEDVPDSLRRDIERLEHIGQWLAVAAPITTLRSSDV